MKRKTEREVLLEAYRQAFNYFDREEEDVAMATAWFDAFDEARILETTFTLAEVLESAAWSAR